MQLTDNEKKVIDKYLHYIHTKSPSNDMLVQIIELSGAYLNLMTISDYAKANGISYNGAKHHRNNIDLFGCKFIVDNK